ncbi:MULTISPECIES: lytic transglycosylase domain-containing protein [Acinetobacter]|uniref:lytic transglycosylase domain-containing protein n=1 Tax=Acinetobacter TaxID=469 RepID=UPI000EA1DC2B|nr:MULTISPECIES: lytic transglycosylase domain-containing protein [Acinetobacter]RKG45160.1 lytic transglycosylase domain-containing protein [Acinetobacter cumulans]RZG60102.1 lytic transglycosylase domain-containing protein [Acinetobacter sp. WCHAc060006]
MANWLSEIDDGEQQSINEMNAKGLGKAPKQKKEVGLFDGAASAIPRGLVAGAVKVADTVSKPFERVADHLQYSIDDVQNGGLDGALDVREPSFSDVHKAKNKDRRDALVLEIEQLQDAQNTGTAGNILFSLSDYGVRALGGGLIAGPVGAAALTGASETNYSRDELIHKGVDESTATKAALIDGGIAAVSTALPLSYGLKGTGGLAADAAISVGGATALSQGGQFASGELLKSEGYDKQAKKYEVTGETVATDLLLNTLFFGAARGAGHYLNRTPEQIEADTTKQQAALVLNELEYDEISAPVQPSNAVQANNHLKNLDSATDDIRAGRPVSVQHPVTGEEKKKPVNYEAMPIPTNAKAIARKAQQEGINPSVALTISHIETGGKFDHTAKNPTSTAHGLFQVLDKTWKGQGGGDRNNVDEQIKQGLKHIRNANASLRKSLGRDPVAHEQYLGHLLGPAGASKVLKADQNAKLIDIVRTYDAKNADAIVNNNGMAGLTVGQAITKWQGKWNQLSARYGGNGTSTAIGMNGSSYDMAYEVKSLGDLIASNDLAYGVNPLYPGELQPRDRTREASRQQIENMANDLRPELLGESSMLSNGAPIIGMDNVVESGNGRTLAITKAYEAGKADDYRAFIEQYAQEKGWDISGVDRPVLVRTRLTDTDRVQFSRLANEADVAQFSASERAVTDIDRLPDSSLLKINNDGTLNIDGSMDFVRGFVDQLPQSERSVAIMPDGRLSQEGKRRIESALVQRAYGDSNLVARLAEALDDDSKTVLNALLRSAPQLAQLSDLVKQGGRHQNTIAQDLAQAAQKLSDLKANGQTVPDYLNQNQLIDDGLSYGAKQFLNVFDTNKRSAKGISENIQSEIDRIEELGDPRQGTLFGDGPEESAALDVILRNPDMPFPNGKIDSDGNPEMYTVKEYWAELEAEAKQAQQDTLAAQTAISCALQFGE